MMEGMSADASEFDEFDVTEDEFDAMTAAGKQTEIVGLAEWLLTPPSGLYALVTSAPETYPLGGSVVLAVGVTRATTKTNVVTQKELITT